MMPKPKGMPTPPPHPPTATAVKRAIAVASAKAEAVTAPSEVRVPPPPPPPARRSNEAPPNDTWSRSSYWRPRAQRWGARGGKNNPNVLWHTAKAKALREGYLDEFLASNPKPRSMAELAQEQAAALNVT